MTYGCVNIGLNSGLAKQINDGFARANGEFVALVHFTTELPLGWLARMQGVVDLDAPVSVCIPSCQDQIAATVSLTEPAGLELILSMVTASFLHAGFSIGLAASM